MSASNQRIQNESQNGYSTSDTFIPRLKGFTYGVVIYSLRPTLFVLFKKSNFLREHHLLSCLSFKNVFFPKLPLNKFIKKLN